MATLRLTYFQITWLLLFFIPIGLTIFDNRMITFAVGFLIYEIWKTWSHFSGGEWVPTPQNIIDRMLKIAQANKNDVVYDLGSGDGKIILSAAKLGATAVGIEIDPLRVLLSKIKIKLARLDNAKVELGDLYKSDARSATIVTLFLLPKTMAKLENKLRKELRKGTKVVSYRFIFKNWKPVKIDETNKIYLYKV